MVRIVSLGRHVVSGKPDLLYGQLWCGIVVTIAKFNHLNFFWILHIFR